MQRNSVDPPTTTPPIFPPGNLVALHPQKKKPSPRERGVGTEVGVGDCKFERACSSFLGRARAGRLPLRAGLSEALRRN